MRETICGVRRLGWLPILIGLCVGLAMLGGCQPQTPAPESPVPSATPSPGATLQPVQSVEAGGPTPAFTPTPSLRTLAEVPQPVSYMAATATSIQLRLVDAGGDWLLLEDLGGFASLKWSPDGRYGAAVTRSAGERALHIIDTSSRAITRTLSVGLSGHLDFRVAEDWSRIIALRSEGATHQVWVVDVPDGSTRQLTQPGQAIAEWDISGDGNWVLIGLEAEGHYSTSVFDVARGIAYELDAGPHPVSEFSSNGRWVCLVGRPAGDTKSRLYLTDLANMEKGTVTRVTAVGESILPAVTRAEGGSSYFSENGKWLGVWVTGASPKLRLRDLGTEQSVDLNLSSDESLDWVLLYPSLRRALVSTFDAHQVRSSTLRLWYLEQRVEISLIEEVESLRLLPGWGSGIAVVDSIQQDGRHLVAVVDAPNGSSHIVLRGGVRPLDLDPQGARVLVALGPAGRSLVHLLDLRVGGTLLDMGFSVGGDDRPATGQFAPFGPALWARVWRTDGAPLLLVSEKSTGPARLVAEGVEDVQFAPAGTVLLFTKLQEFGGGIYVTRSDGTGTRLLANGYAPRWHPVPSF